jgi:hypothetical protein
MRRINSIATLGALVGVLWAPQVSAAPITLTFAGHWSYYDLGMTDPEHLALEAAFGNVGVVSGGTSSLGTYPSGTPVSFSMTVNPAAPAGSFGQYAGALLGAQLTVGSLAYVVEPADMSSSGWLFGPARVSGPTVSGNGMSFVPMWVGLSSDVSAPNSLAEAIANAHTWSNTLVYISFRPPGFPFPSSEGHLAFSGLQLTSVSVPEVGTLPLAGAALALAVVWQRRRAVSRLT